MYSLNIISGFGETNVDCHIYPILEFCERRITCKQNIKNNVSIVFPTDLIFDVFSETYKVQT